MSEQNMLTKEDIDNMPFSNFVYIYGDLKSMIDCVKYYIKKENNIVKANEYNEQLEGYMSENGISKEISFYIRGSYRKRVKEFKQKLKDFGIIYSRIGWDEYDNSLELYDVPNDFKLNEEIQKFIYDAGFATCYVNHVNKWETHYNWNVSKEFKISDGWEVRYPHKCKGIEKIQIKKIPESWININKDHFEIVSD